MTSVTGTNTYFIASVAAPTAAAVVFAVGVCMLCFFRSYSPIEMQLNLFVHYTCNSLFISNHAVAFCAFFLFCSSSSSSRIVYVVFFYSDTISARVYPFNVRRSSILCF